jgi:hypothetical protein
MSPELQLAVNTLKASYGDIDREAATYINLDPKDIANALKSTQIDTADFVVLALLSTHFPVTAANNTMVVNDVVLPTSVINEAVVDVAPVEVAPVEVAPVADSTPQ